LIPLLTPVIFRETVPLSHTYPLNKIHIRWKISWNCPIYCTCKKTDVWRHHLVYIYLLTPWCKILSIRKYFKSGDELIKTIFFYISAQISYPRMTKIISKSIHTWILFSWRVPLCSCGPVGERTDKMTDSSLRQTSEIGYFYITHSLVR